MNDLTLELDDTSATTRLIARGSLDAYTSRTLQARVVALADEPQDLIVNVADLEFIDSAGLGALVRLHKRARAASRTLTIEHPREAIMWVVRVAGLDKVFHIVPAPADADG